MTFEDESEGYYEVEADIADDEMEANTTENDDQISFEGGDVDRSKKAMKEMMAEIAENEDVEDDLNDVKKQMQTASSYFNAKRTQRVMHYLDK